MHGNRSKLYLKDAANEDADDDDDHHHNDDDDEHDDEDQNGHSLTNFQARGSRFCVVIDLHNT